MGNGDPWISSEEQGAWMCVLCTLANSVSCLGFFFFPPSMPFLQHDSVLPYIPPKEQSPPQIISEKCRFFSAFAQCRYFYISTENWRFHMRDYRGSHIRGCTKSHSPEFPFCPVPPLAVSRVLISLSLDLFLAKPLISSDPMSLFKNRTWLLLDLIISFSFSPRTNECYPNTSISIASLGIKWPANADIFVHFKRHRRILII